MSGLLDRLRRGDDPRARLARLSVRLDALEQASACARGRLPDDVVHEVSRSAGLLRERVTHAPDVTLVALAGATGAGKSSLFNALTGQDVAPVGVRRPTTSDPLAGLWSPTPDGEALLRWLDVGRVRVLEPAQALTQAPDASPALPDGLILLDLPDHDSTTAAHRAAVDRLVERVDVTVWVVDPQKYADAVLHEQYLKALAHHSAATLVALNQVDRLRPDEAAACVEDLRRLLALDGLPDVRVIATSAVTGTGVDDLRRTLVEVAAGRRAALQRVDVDVIHAATTLRDAAGSEDWSAAPSQVRDSTREQLVRRLAQAAGRDVVGDAVERSLRMRAARSTGWPLTRWLGGFRSDPVRALRLDRRGVDPTLVTTSMPSADPVAVAAVGDAVRKYTDERAAAAPQPWVRSARSVAAVQIEALPPVLDAAVARTDVMPQRQPWWWATVGCVQWGLLAVAVAGGLWLLALAALRFFALPVPTTPDVEGLPVPTVMLVTGLLAGAVLAAAARALAGRSAARAGRRARDAVTATVREAADAHVIAPIEAELASLQEFGTALAVALSNGRS